jgi:hypothetical protein
MARSLQRSGRFPALELAIAFAIFGTLLAATLPTFVRSVRASRLAEPIQGLREIGTGAVVYGHTHPVSQGFPPSVSLTPSRTPRGRCETDPPGTWDQPTWTALHFRPFEVGACHCFSFGFDSTLSPTRSGFRAHAHGDLDGDGITSTFEITGHYVEGDPQGPVTDPGMFIDSEVE